MEIILIPKSLQWWNECSTCYCVFWLVCAEGRPVESKKPLWPPQQGPSVTMEELRDLSWQKESHDMKKNPNIPLFHIRTCFSLKVDVKRAAWQNMPLLLFPKKRVISRLAGSSPEVRGCFLTWAGISLKTAQSNCSFEATHITDGTVNIAPTSLGTFLPTLLYFFLPFLWRKIHYLSHTFY